MIKIRILLYSEDLRDPVSYYRGMAPMIELSRDYLDIYFMTINGQTAEMPTWAELSQFDIVMLQRPASLFAYQVAIQAQLCACKVIVDYDDLLTDVPKENPTYDYYMRKDTQLYITQILLRHDFLKIVSTPFLKRAYEKLGATNIHVVPNALHKRLMDSPDFSYGKAQTDFSWRGSATHELDLFEYRDQIHEAMGSVEYIGFRPNTLMREGFDKFTKPMPVMDYYYNLRNNVRNNFFVTLCDSDFNKSKSNIAYIEATWAGAVVLAPDWEEWCLPGCVTYSSKEDFVVKAKEILSMNMDARKRLWLQAANHINDNMTLDKMNEKRYELIRSLL